ncbi:hypothetical protein Pan44_29290 [Caulifigura coniformis]|uniref:Glutamine amidotransferase domain-containing protein n=1 Tax=Caulifigura coniformis TaxID=2527983 RepID=A0A517SFM1_9PLAN|nr:hypothetical protein [Caulifigura coniformis]QDT54890.1 hypothetical protein Pan44_29290 [Caulifigura coniformis]
MSKSRSQWLFRLRTLAAVASLLAVAAPVLSQAAEVPPASTIKLGINGKLKVGSWTPIQVELPAPAEEGAQVVAVTTDFENNLLETPLVAASPTHWSGLVQVGRLEGPVRVILRNKGSESAVGEVQVTPEGEASPASFRQDTEFWGVLGSTARFADAANEWTASLRANRGRTVPSAAVAMTLTWDDLPEQIEAWDALDVLVVSGDAFAAPASKSETLRRWVERGGRALFLLGSSTDRYTQSAMGSWSPIVAAATVNVVSLDMIKARVRRSAPLLLGLRRSVPAAHLPGTPEGTLPGPAVLSKPYGFGLVTAFAFDFEQPPLSTWESQTSLLQQLTLSSMAGSGRGARDSELASTGVTDLASQMASGLDHFDDVRRASFRGVMAWTALWVLILFPLDYLVVHKVLKRPHLTWLTLPLLIAAATLIAARSARAANTAPLTLNQIDLIDFTPARSTARVRSWMTFYSGETTRYDVAATSPVAGPAGLAWSAKPEEGLRGLYRQGGINFGAPSFETTADHTRLEELPVRLWSSYSVAAEANRDLGGQPPMFESVLSESEAGRLRGEIRHHLSGPLNDWIVLYKNFLYHPVPARGELAVGEWASGGSWRPDFDGQSTLVKGYLQGARQFLAPGKGKDLKMKEVQLEVATYDASEFDPNRLIRFLSFHQAAGGSAYTGLANAPLAKLDLSRMLDIGPDKGIDCAVVIGRLETPAMNYEINGAAVKPAGSWTFVRGILPVQTK